MLNAYYPTLCGYLGLSVSDIAEIGGFSDRFARDIVKGKRPFPADLREALDLLKDDIDVMVDFLCADVEEGAGAIFVFRDNDELRRRFKAWPARGKSGGGFVGPHRAAAMSARDILDDQGIEVDIMFFDIES